MRERVERYLFNRTDYIKIVRGVLKYHYFRYSLLQLISEKPKEGLKRVKFILAHRFQSK